MNRSSLFIPLAQYSVFLYDTQTHHSAVMFPRDTNRMPEQFRSDPLMPVLQQFGKITQFTFIVLFQEQLIITPEDTAFLIQKHHPVFLIHMPHQSIFICGKSNISRRVILRETEFIRYGLMAVSDYLDAFGNIFPVDFSNHYVFISLASKIR